MRHPVPSIRRATPRALSRAVARLALGVALLTGSACQIITGPRAQQVSLTISPSTVQVGQSIQASAVAQKKNGNPMTRPVGFKSSDPSIATVTATGVITGVAPGSVTITATSDGKSASQIITVTKATPTVVQVTPSFLTLRIGGNTGKLTATALDAQGRAITGAGAARWESPNTTIATVTPDGTVTGLAPGVVDVIAEIDGRQGVARITVTQIPVKSITLSPDPLNVTEGQQLQFTATLRDSADRITPGSLHNITWSITDQTIALISQGGVVQGVKAGTATVTAIVDGGAARDDATVVVAERNVAFVFITSGRNPFFRLGSPSAVSATAFDSLQAPIPNRLITYVSRSPSVLTVTTNGGNVNPVSVGSAWIIASAGGKSDSVLARVTEQPIASVALVPLQPTVTGGQTIQFQAVLRDQSGNIVTGRPIEWTTNNPALLTISPTGLLTTAVSNGGSGQVSAVVDVVPGFAEKLQGVANVTVLPTPVASISVTPSPITLQQGRSLQITVTMRDANGVEIRGRAFVIQSSDPNVVQIDASRLTIVGVSPGSATLTVQSVNALNQTEGPITTVGVTITAPTVAASRAPAAVRRLP